MIPAWLSRWLDTPVIGDEWTGSYLYLTRGNVIVILVGLAVVVFVLGELLGV